MRLEQLAGNGRLKQSLPGPDRLPHALLLTGAPGSGRHTLADLLTQALVCDHPDRAPCGSCPNCHRAAAGIHPDAPPLSAFVSGKDREKRMITVDTIRALRSDVIVLPNQAQRKIYRIDPAERMNPNAQNALLKVLEDGPAYATFLLISDNPMALLPTIRSRCVALRLTPVDTAEAVQVLSRRFPDREIGALTRAAEQSRGLLGQAITLLEGTAGEDNAVVSALEGCWKALESSSTLALMEWAVGVQNDKLTRDQLSRVYALLRQRLLEALAGRRPSPGPEAQVLSRLTELCAVGMEAMERNVSPAISAGWFAVKCEEALPLRDASL